MNLQVARKVDRSSNLGFTWRQGVYFLPRKYERFLEREREREREKMKRERERRKMKKRKKRKMREEQKYFDYFSSPKMRSFPIFSSFEIFD